MSAHANTDFPAIRLADERGGEDPAEARKRMLKQLADRLDEHHAFAKGQFVVWKAGLKNRKFPGLRRAGDRDRGLAGPGLRSGRSELREPLFPGAAVDRHRRSSRRRFSRVPRRRPPLRADRRVSALLLHSPSQTGVLGRTMREKFARRAG